MKPNSSLKDRASDITHFRFLCEIIPSTVDTRLRKIDGLTFKLCFALPQHLLTIEDEKITLLSSPSSKGNRVKRTLASVVVEDSDDENDDTERELDLAGEGEGKDEADTTPVSKRSKISDDDANVVSPKMKMFLKSNDSSSGTKKGFFGPLTFLDSQENFNTTLEIPQLSITSNHLDEIINPTQREEINCAILLNCANCMFF